MAIQKWTHGKLLTVIKKTPNFDTFSHFFALFSPSKIDKKGVKKHDFIDKKVACGLGVRKVEKAKRFSRLFLAIFRLF